MELFEKLGEAEKAAAKRLTDTFEKHDEKLKQHQYFVSEEEYHKIEEDLKAAYLKGDTEKVTSIVEATELRRVPVLPGFNSRTSSPELT